MAGQATTNNNPKKTALLVHAEQPLAEALRAKAAAEHESVGSVMRRLLRRALEQERREERTARGSR